MTIATVVAALNRSINGQGQIDLFAAAASEPTLAPLTPVLAHFTIASSFVLSGASVVPTATAATLTGTGTWGLAGALPANVVAIAARLECKASSSTSDDVAFTLNLTVTTPNWTFATTFPSLPPTPANVNNAIKEVTSYLASVRVDSCTFTGSSLDSDATLLLKGVLPLTSFWQSLPNWAWYSGFVGPWPMQLTGTVILPTTLTDAPTLDALATNPASKLALGTGLPTLSNLGFGLGCEPAESTPEYEAAAVSTLVFTGQIKVGTLSATLSGGILTTNTMVFFAIEFDSTDTDTVTGMDQITSLFGLPSVPTPQNFIALPGFRFRSVQFYVTPGKSFSDFSLDYVIVAIESSRSWTSPLPFITIDTVGISWQFALNSGLSHKTNWIASNVYGTIAFGTTNPVRVDVALAIPAWAGSAIMRDGDYIPIGDFFGSYFANSSPATPDGMNVVELAIEASPLDQSYSANARILFGTPAAFLANPTAVDQSWSVNLGILTIKIIDISVQVSMYNGDLSGGFGGTFSVDTLTPGSLPATFLLQADYPGPADINPEGWTFSGQLLPGNTLSITNLVLNFMGQSSTVSWLPQLQIDRLYFRFSTGAPTYAFGGTISMAWAPEIFGTTLKVAAAASLDLAKAANADNAKGTLSGLFSINKLLLTASMSLGVPQQTYEFQVQFGDVWFRAVTSWRKTGDAPEHQVITLQLGGATVGSVLEYLVNLAAPTLGYSLPAPWNVLNSIELSRFSLTLDPTDNVVEFVYAANADLVFMRLDTIGVRYTRGEKGGVSLILTGELLGQRYDGDDLAWDVINESPPDLPGQGTGFISLRYLGIGQRVALSRLPDTVAETLALLEGEMKEVSGTDQNPLDGQGVVWSPESQFLIGLDIGLLDTLDLGIVFNDPFLYGLSIALGGEKAGSLSGLRFEILYKKISDSVGMFRIELTLPEAFRTFEFGEVSVTLGVVVIEIYTNGNFKVDLGFPYNRSFERSFTVQVFPFIGRGGIYFGLLDGTTSKRVPKITNGSFAPVIELGVGLAIGVGKDIHVGPLSGGIYVEVEVIFEGVLAWFHPTTSGGSTSVYYWAQGVAAIHGKLYGSVDFAIIKVSVTLEAYAAAMVTLESHRPTIFALEVRVSAEAEIKILFIRISFSFSVELSTSFTVGSSSATPWILATDQSSETVSTLKTGVAGSSTGGRSLSVLGRSRQRLAGPRRRPSQRIAVLAAAHLQAVAAQRMALVRTGATPEVETIGFNWQPTEPVFTDSPRTAPMVLIPSFTVGSVPLSWTGTAPSNLAPQYRYALQLFASTGVPTTAMTAAAAGKRSAALSAHASDETDLDVLPSDTLISGFLYYCLYAIPADPVDPEDPTSKVTTGPQDPTRTVTAGQLALANSWLNDPTQTSGGFNQDALFDFFEANIHLAVTGLPSQAEDTADIGAMAVAMPPAFNWTSVGYPSVNLATDNKVGPVYLWELAQIAASFSPNQPSVTDKPDDSLTDYVPYASHVFSDWCLIIARAAMREAAAKLDNRVLPAASATDTLAIIADGQPSTSVPYPVRPNDTVETVADSLGATVDEILALNEDLPTLLQTSAVGSLIDVLLGISPEVLASDNPTAQLHGTTLDLGDIIAPVTANDTLSLLATRFGVTMTAILSTPGQGTDAKLLAAGSSFAAPAASWTTAPATVTMLAAAATFYVRYAETLLATDEVQANVAAWYAQAVADLNLDLLKLTASYESGTVELVPGLPLSVPIAFNDKEAAATKYTTVPGDTLSRIGFMLNLVQNEATTPGTTGWPLFRSQVTAITGGFSLPTWPGVQIAPAETLEMLARRTIVNWTASLNPVVWSANWAGLATWIGTASILQSLALITIPAVTITPTSTTTFASVAETTGLTLGELGHRLAEVPGLVNGETLTVLHLPADTVQSLVALVLAGSTASIAAEASRFLFSGQQVPVPVPVPGETGHVTASTTSFAPLFDETLQQQTVTVDKNTPAGVALDVVLQTSASWITLYDNTVAGPNEAPAQLQARAPAAFAAPANRGLIAGRQLPAGTLVHTDAVTSLTYSYTNAEIQALVPATGLAWPPTLAPEALPVRGEAPVTYGLSQHITLQTPVTLPVPGFELGTKTLSIHPFPPALLTRAEATDYTNPDRTQYAVYIGAVDTTVAAPVDNGTFLSLIGFTVRRIVETPGVYQLVGADVEQLPLLLDLVAFLGSKPKTTTGYIGVSPATTSGNPSGIQVVDGTGWLLKTNLSTETVPPTMTFALADPAPQPAVRADLSDLINFALLLWEGSVVGGAGFLFGVTDGLSDGAFDASDQATLQLIVFSEAHDTANQSQIKAAGTGTTDPVDPVVVSWPLLPFDTAYVVVDQGLPDGNLFAEANESTDPSDFVAQALVPAGSAGYQMILPRPILPTPPATDAQLALRQAYSMVLPTAVATTASPYTISAGGPTGQPQASDGTIVPPHQSEQARRVKRANRGLARLASDPTPPVDPAPLLYWAYQAVLPVYRFGPASCVPLITDPSPPPENAPYRVILPLPANDPYRGVGTATSAPGLALTLQFGDVMGNRSTTSGNPIPVPLGYTDPLDGPTTWPAASLSYKVSGAPGAVVLGLTLSSKPQTLMPTVNQAGDALLDQAANQRDTYAEIYYQYAQPGLTATVATSLNTSATLATTGGAGLLAFAAGSYLASDVAARLAPVIPASAKLSAIVSSYDIDWETLAAANLRRLLSQMFGANVGLITPAFVIVASGDSATSIAATTRPPGWPTPTGLALLSLSQNTSLPLRAGAVLTYTSRAITLPADSPAAPLTLTLAATAAFTTAAWLAEDSAADAILVTNFVLMVDDVSITVGVSTISETNPAVVKTFADASAAFADRGVQITAYFLGDLYADVPGLLIPSAAAHSAHFLADGAATLETNNCGAATNDLIAKNVDLANLFDTGALVYLGTFGGNTVGATVVPGASDTLNDFAARYGCPPAVLLAANTDLTIPAGTTLTIPGAVTLPDASTFNVAYTILAGDTLQGIGARFNGLGNADGPTLLATTNGAVPGTVAQGVSFTVTVGSTPVPINTTGLTSFNAVLAKVQVTAPTAVMADVAAAFNVAGRLQTGGFLVCPPAKLAAALKPTDLPTQYGVSAAAFGLANAGVIGLVATNVALSAPNPLLTTKITPVALDTLNSLVQAFNDLALRAGLPADITVASLINANPALAMFASGTLALLPPTDVTLTSAPGDVGPYPAAAFSLTVELIVSRPHDLVHADFVGTGAEFARATIQAASSSTAGGSMTYNDFAAAFVAALPKLRLATAKVEGETSDLWVVNFGDAGIKSVALAQPVTYDAKTKPRMMALAPLYGHLVSRAGVPIAPLTATGMLNEAGSVDHDFQGIDVQVWASRFLSDFDRLLLPSTAATLGNQLPTQFATLMATKATLQSAIPADLTSVFVVNPTTGPQAPRGVTDPTYSAGLTEAKRLYGQWLGISLAAAWSTAVVVQYNATVQSSWITSPSASGDAAFYGEAKTSEQVVGNTNGAAASDDPPIDPVVVDPGWRLAAGKVSLSTASPFLTLPLTVSDPGQQASIPLDLTYQVSNVEINSRSVAAAVGYKRSDWLAMTPLLAGTNVPTNLSLGLGQADVPIPLRSFPALPLLIAQDGIADPTDPVTLASAPIWAFQLVYAHEHAAQDNVLVTAQFNLSPPKGLMAFAVEDADLFTALAQYIQVADPLAGLLAALDNASDQPVTPTTTNAVGSFVTMAGDIAGLWNTRLAESQAAAQVTDDWIPATTAVFSAKITYGGGAGRALAIYTLTRDLDQSSGAAVDWPTVFCQQIDGTQVELIGQTPDGNARQYLPKDGKPIIIDGWPRFTLAWTGLNTGTTQNARARLQVTRNVDLLLASGPATAPVFIYRTATVTASSIFTPSINRTDRLSITGTSVTTALQSAFDALYPPATRPTDLKLTLGLYYGYHLADGTVPLVSELAVKLMPDQTLTSNTAASVAAELQDWNDKVKPNQTGGAWTISLTQYSSYDPGKRVLLAIEGLTYDFNQTQ